MSPSINGFDARAYLAMAAGSPWVTPSSDKMCEPSSRINLAGLISTNALDTARN